MLHWRQQGVAVSTIEICSLNPLEKEVSISSIIQNIDPPASNYSISWETRPKEAMFLKSTLPISHTLRKADVPFALLRACSRTSKQLIGYQRPNDTQY